MEGEKASDKKKRKKEKKTPVFLLIVFGIQFDKL